jgi:hypothetical protein
MDRLPALRSALHPLDVKRRSYVLGWYSDCLDIDEIALRKTNATQRGRLLGYHQSLVRLSPQVKSTPRMPPLAGHCKLEFVSEYNLLYYHSWSYLLFSFLSYRQIHFSVPFRKKSSADQISVRSHSDVFRLQTLDSQIINNHLRKHTKRPYGYTFEACII